MRESRAVQGSIFDPYSQNEHGQMLCSLSDLLDIVALLHVGGLHHEYQRAA